MIKDQYTLFYIFTTFPPEVTGSAIYNWERVKYLANLGCYRIIIMAPDWQNKTLLPSVPDDLKDNLIIIPYSSKSWLPYRLHKVPTLASVKYINQNIVLYQPDLIVAVDLERLFLFSTWQLPGRQYAKKHHIPYLTEYHTDYFNHTGTYLGGKLLQKTILKPLFASLYNQCDVTLAFSDYGMASLDKLGVNNHHYLSFYGLDLSEYSSQQKNREFLKHWLTPEEENNQIILFVGRLAHEKRIDLLIDAYRQLEPEKNHYSLIIAGDGPSEIVQFLKASTASLNNVHYTGFIQGKEKAMLMASCDVYCSPAPYETFGRTIIEAMASGIPIVTVDSGAVSAHIVSGINGYLVSPNDSVALSSTLKKVLSADNRSIIEHGLNDADNFSIKTRCEHLHHYYQRLLKEPSSQLCSEKSNQLQQQETVKVFN